MVRIVLFCLLMVTYGCKEGRQDSASQNTQIQYSNSMKESIDRGADIYNNFCASCHLSSGEGIKGVFPPLQNSDWLTQKQDESIHAIKYGLKGPIEVNGEDYDNLMPALGLSNKEIADVMNYINTSWGNKVNDPVTEEEVGAITK